LIKNHHNSTAVEMSIVCQTSVKRVKGQEFSTREYLVDI